MRKRDILASLDEFTRGYIECALRSSTTLDDEPMDKNHDINDITFPTLRRMVADCQSFQDENDSLILDERINSSRFDQYGLLSCAGHDFWLTRNRHGAGFWDGDWRITEERPIDGTITHDDSVANTLTRAAHEFGEFHLEVYRGKIYGS